jgi:hypothetical protein
MKKATTISLFIVLFVTTCYSQDQDYEKKNYFELKARTKFLEVNKRYKVQKDTIFFTNSGFLINPEWDEAMIDEKPYVVITYPNFKNGVQSASEKPNKDDFTGAPVNYPLSNLNGKMLAILKEDFDKIPKEPIYSISFKKLRNYQFTTGQLTLPFKLRPKLDNKKFQMTTDVTIGAYGGIRKRLSARSPTYLTVPFVLGLSLINVNDNTTVNTGTADFKSGITPGWTWATGLVFQLNKFNAGLVLGRDYASGYAEDWIYHNKTWYSFAIGYSFVK